MPDQRRRAFHFFPIALLIASTAQAASLNEKLQALAAASSTAAQICTTVPMAQRSQAVTLTAGAQTYLSKFVSWLAKIKISGAAKYQTTSSQGVLQKDLAQSIRQSNDCKRAVFNNLMDKLIAEGSQSAPPKTASIKVVPKPVVAAKTPAAPNSPAGPLSTVPTSFDKSNGQFVKKGQFWIETPPYAPGQNFAFTELSHDKDYLYLVDRSRAAPGTADDPMVVRLPIKGGWAQWTYQSPPVWKDFIIVEPSKP